MKKRIFSIIALALVCVFTLSACDGCFNLPEQNFTNAFNGGSGLREDDPPSGYTETLTYDVVYSETGEGIAIDSNLKEDKDLSFTFSEGKYVSTLTVYKSFAETGKGIESDIIDGLEDNETQAYHLHTELSLKVNYGIGEKSYEHIDTIVSDSYFCETSLAFAPVYTKTVADYTTLHYSKSKSLVGVKTESETIYSKNNYKVTFTTLGENLLSENATTGTPTTTVKEYEYKYKTVIDNTQLLFALRSFDVELEKSAALAVVAPNYGEATTLAVNNKQLNSVTYLEGAPLKVNYEDFVGAVEVKHYRYYKNEAKETGTAQHLFIQNKVENSSLPYKALPVRYIESLTTYGNFLPMGALVYTLSSVEF